MSRLARPCSAAPWRQSSCSACSPHKGTAADDHAARLCSIYCAERVLTKCRWRRIGDQLGRLPETCRDRWRKLELGARKVTGAWSPEEVQALREAVAEHQAEREVRLGVSRGRGCVGTEHQRQACSSGEAQAVKLMKRQVEGLGCPGIYLVSLRGPPGLTCGQA